MGLFEDDFDTDVLRALGHARLHITAGSGIESILFALTKGDLGYVSHWLGKGLVEIRTGGELQSVFAKLTEQSGNEAFGKLLRALVFEGEAAIAKLDELSDEILLNKRLKAQEYGERLGGVLQFATVVFLGTFSVVLLGAVEILPEHEALPSIDFRKTFYDTLFGGLTMALGASFYFAWYRG